MLVRGNFAVRRAAGQQQGVEMLIRVVDRFFGLKAVFLWSFVWAVGERGHRQRQKNSRTAANARPEICLLLVFGGWL